MANELVEEDEKLSLKDFVLKSLNKYNYCGFEWINGSKNMFKIPWADKDKPGWELLDQISSVSKIL